MATTDILAQAKGFLEKLSRIQKIAFGAAATLVVAGIIALIGYASSSKDMGLLFNNLEPADAAKIVEYLKASQIEYQIVEDGTAVLVEKDKVYDTRLSLANQGLPADSYMGFELFDKTNLGMSEFVQKVNYRRALEGELQRTIKSMNEVKDVKVHLVIPEKTLFKKDERQPTAAIKLHFKSGRSLSKINIEGIQNLVASSIEGLTPDNVTVTDNNGRILSEAAANNNTLAGLTATQYEQQRKIEEYYSFKVQSLLDPALGPENSRVKLNTEIDFDQLQVNKTDYDPERQVERSEQNISDTETDIDTSFVPGINKQKEVLNELKNYEITKADSHFVKGIGGIKRLTVTAIVNEIVDVRKTPKGMDTVVSRPRTQEELENLKEAIKNVVGYDERRGDEVNVLCVPFVDQLADKIYQIQEHNHEISIPWYEKDNNRKLLLLLLAVLLTAFMMYRLIHAKFVKDKMRIAMGLPKKLEQPELNKFDSSLITLPEEEFYIDEDYDDEDEVLELQEEIEEASILEELIDDTEDEFEDIQLEDDDLIVMSEELPEQLLLDGQFIDDMDFFDSEYTDEYVPHSGGGSEHSTLIERAQSALAVAQPADEISEDEMIRMELKDKVHQFITGQPDTAVKIFRIFISQDGDDSK